MYRHLLIATDGSELGHKAVGQGLTLARAVGAKATIVIVTEAPSDLFSSAMTTSFPRDMYDKSAASGAATIFAAAADVARKSGVACDTVHVKDKHPAEGIVETAQNLGCDLIVMASHGRRGISRMLLGSQAGRVVVLSPVPVLICR